MRLAGKAWHQRPRGPYAKTWEEGDVWRVRLTDEGRKVLEDYLRKYPEPARLVKSRYPSLYWGCRAAGIPHDEINQVALYGLVRAIACYDPKRGTEFITVGARHIRSALQVAIKKTPYLADPIAVDLLTSNHQPGDRLLMNEVQTKVRNALKILDPRDRKVIEMRYGLTGNDPKRQPEIGKRLGVTKQRVQAIEKKALIALRDYVKGLE
jgi:RNA polymerase sporulation-specific sigma factor